MPLTIEEISNRINTFSDGELGAEVRRIIDGYDNLATVLAARDQGIILADVDEAYLYIEGLNFGSTEERTALVKLMARALLHIMVGDHAKEFGQ